MLLGGLGIGHELLDRMDRHHALGRQRGLRLEIFVVGIEADRHHVGAELHQLDLLLDARRGDAELHDRIDLAHDRVLQPLPVGVMDARHLPAVGLDGLFQCAAAVDMRDRGAGIDGVDVLLRHARDVLLHRAERVVRIGGAGVAGDRDDQLFHGAFPSSHRSLNRDDRVRSGADSTIASNTDMPCSTSSIETGYGRFSRIARANAVSSALSMSKPACSLTWSGGAMTGPVGAWSDVGTKRNRLQVGLGDLRQALAAVERERRNSWRSRPSRKSGRSLRFRNGA